MLLVLALTALAADDIAPPPPAEAIDASKFTVQGALPADAVKAVVKDGKAAVVDCYHKAVMAQGDLAGRLTLQWVIGDNGAVKSAKLLSDEMSSPSIEDCIAKYKDDKKNKAAELCFSAKKKIDGDYRPNLVKCVLATVRKWQFGKPDSGTATVTYPFALGTKTEKMDFTQPKKN